MPPDDVAVCPTRGRSSCWGGAQAACSYKDLGRKHPSGKLWKHLGRFLTCNRNSPQPFRTESSTKAAFSPTKDKKQRKRKQRWGWKVGGATWPQPMLLQKTTHLCRVFRESWLSSHANRKRTLALLWIFKCNQYNIIYLKVVALVFNFCKERKSSLFSWWSEMTQNGIFRQF